MTSPWDDKQKPNEKSKFHDKKDGGHGPHEFSGGAKKPVDKTDAPTLKDFLVSAQAPSIVVATASIPDEVLSIGAFVSKWYQPHRPPILNQHDTPMCVAYCNSSDQAHM